MKKIRKIGIIGAGLGGLAAAVRLADAGFDVDVYEQNSSPGGKATQINENSFRFDTGPSLLTMPFVLNQIFDDCNENIENYLTIEKLTVICKYFYPDGKIIDAFGDRNKFANEIETKTKDTSETVLKYLDYCKNIYDLTGRLFLFNSPKQIKTYLNKQALLTLLQLKKIDPFRSMHKANTSFFKDEKTIQLFDRYATYNGSNPYEAPATLNIIQHVEYNLGAYFVKGGIYQIIEALFKLAVKKGVNFHFNKKADAIIKKDNSIEGIIIDNKKLFYDAVLSNVDVNLTYRHLLKEQNSKPVKKLEKLEPSLSGIVFYWGVKGNHDQLETHNILFSENYKKEFDQIFDGKVTPDDPTVYIYISSKKNNNDAPAGFENWFVMINAPYIDNQYWNKEIENSKDRIIKKIKSVLKIDLNDKIVFEKILSPEILESKTGSYRGSIYGISSNDRNTAFLRHSNKSPYYKNLYFCGGSVHPGGGIPLVLLSGKIASDLIKKELKK